MTAPTRTIADRPSGRRRHDGMGWPRAPRLRPRRRASHPPVRIRHLRPPAAASRTAEAAHRRADARAAAGAAADSRSSPGRSRPRTSSSAARRSTRPTAPAATRRICADGRGKNPNLLRRASRCAIRRASSIAARHHAAHAALHAASRPTRSPIAEYIHSIHATMGGQGSPPGRNPTNVDVERARRRRRGRRDGTSTPLCATCHSVTGDLKGIGVEVLRSRARSRTRGSAGSSGRFGGGGGGARRWRRRGNPATVTMADGSKLEGTLVRKDDWLVILIAARRHAQVDGAHQRRAQGRRQGSEGGRTRRWSLELDDCQNKKMHDITAYLWTIK